MCYIIQEDFDMTSHLAYLLYLYRVGLGSLLRNKKKSSINVSLGPRPYVLVESMKPSDLKTKLGTY